MKRTLAAVLAILATFAGADAAFETIGIYADLSEPPGMMDYVKACGYNTYELLDAGWSRRPDLHEEYYARLEKGIAEGRARGMKVYVILLTNMQQWHGPEPFKDVVMFQPDDAALMKERLEYLTKTVQRLKMADGFTFFAGDPGGDIERRTTVDDFLTFANNVRAIVRREAPDAAFLVNSWAIAAWDQFPSPFTAEFWDKEVRLTKAIVNHPGLIGPDTGIEFPMHNYYRSLAIDCYVKENRAPELYPVADDVASLKAKGVKRMWGYPYFLVDECDDGYSGHTWAHAQAETRYLHRVVNAARDMGLNGIVGNVSQKGSPAEVLNVYAFARFAQDPDATPESVLREFAGTLVEEQSVDALTEVLAFIENHSSWEGGIPTAHRLPPLPTPLKEVAAARAQLSTVSPRPTATLPMPEAPAEYLKRLDERLVYLSR